MLYHYTYVIGHRECGYFYVGKRTSKVAPHLDPYMGSGRRLKELKRLDPQGWIKEVLAIHPTAEAAYDHETALATTEVVRHSACLNLVQGGWGLRRPLKHTEAAKQKVSAANAGKVRTLEQRAAMSRQRAGKPKTASHVRAQAIAQSKPCTVDGSTIYPSVSAMFKALGRKGRASPTFRFVELPCHQ